MPATTLRRTERSWLTGLLERRKKRPRAAARLAWVTPTIVVLVVAHYATRPSRPIALLVGILFVFLAARRPDRALAALILIQPFEVFILGFLLGLHVPTSVLRSMGYWKDGITAGMVVAAYRSYKREPRRFDRIDIAAVAYIAVAVGWFVVPHLLAQHGADIPSTYARELALRLDVEFVVIFLAARHARLGREWAERMVKPVLVVGAIVAGVGIYEYFFTASWNNIAINTFHVIAYETQVLHAAVSSTTDVEFHSFAGTQPIIRIGSVLLDPLILGSWLVIPLAVGVERLARGAGRFGSLIAVAMITTTLLMTQTRSAVLGGVIVLLVATRPAPGRDTTNRIRFALVCGFLLLVSLPVAAGIGFTARSISATNGSDASTTSHIKSFTIGVDAAVNAPLGRGLGTAPTIGARFDVAGAVTSENYYLQVADELGLAALVAFLLFVIFGLRRMGRSQFEGPGGTLLSAARTAGLGLAVGAFLLHVWAGLPVAMLYWSLAGAAVGVADVERPTADRPPAVDGDIDFDFDGDVDLDGHDARARAQTGGGGVNEIPPGGELATLPLAVDAVALTSYAATRGVGTYARNVLRGMAADPGLSIVAIAPEPVAVPPGVRIQTARRHAPRRWRIPEHRMRLPFDIRRTGAAVFWEPTPDPPSRCHIPAVQTLFDVIPLQFPDPGMEAERRRWKHYAASYRSAAAVIAISRHSADQGIRLLGLDPGRVHVCHLGAGPEFHPGEATSPPADPPYLLLVSEYSRRKGYEEAFAAVAGLADAGFPHVLKVAGRVAPWVAPTVEALRQQSNRPDRIEIVGFTDDLAALYRGATAFVGASRFEGFGLPALEAMSCGTPVVAFANSATTEVVADGGMLVEDGDIGALTDGLRRVISDEAFRDELRERALRRAADFSWDRCAAMHIEIIRSAAGAPTEGRVAS